MVANKIYIKTHEGLTDLVSARVASQVLDNGLRARRYSAETVTVGQMASVLKGPVMKELSGSLPQAGLERSLKKVLKTLKTMPPEKPKPTAPDSEEVDLDVDEAVVDEAVANEAVMDEAEIAETQGAKGLQVEEASAAETSSTAPSSTAPSSHEPTRPDTAGSDARSETSNAEATDEPVAQPEPVSTFREHAERSAVVSSGAAAGTQVLESVAPPVQRAPLEPAARDRVMLGFAELEHVKMVAAFENGGVSSVLGQGFEVAALSRLGTLGLKLLGRSGDLRTFYVAHSQGQLFLFPFGAVTLMLIGSSELNLGLVFATLQKLKEEL